VASLRNSQITLGSAYPHRLLNTSQNAALLGWTTTATSIDSSLPYVLYAPLANSVVNIGAPAGPNGKLYIGGKVLAHKAIHLFSGASDPGLTDDTQWVDLEVTGLLETLSGSITLSPNARTVLRGDVIARGETSDVIITATESIDLRGSLEAGRNVIVSAGSVVRPGTESIRTRGTSEIRTLNGGSVRISGVNDVVIDSVVGPGSTNLSLVELQSTTGDLLIAEESGRIETSARIDFLGNNVEIAGVVKSTAATPSLTDYEIRIDIAGHALLHSDFNLAGSLLVDAAAITIYNQQLVVSGSGQRLAFHAADSLTMGRTETLPNGKLQQLGAVISAPDLQIDVAGLLTVNAGSAIFGAREAATLLITAGDMQLIGTIYGGAFPGESAKPVWLPAGALTLDISGSLTMGGPGVDAQGALTTIGGNLIATGAVLIKTGDVVAISETSSIKADPSGEQAIEATDSGNLRLEVGTDLQLNGLLQSLGPASRLAIEAGSQVRINGLVDAQSSVTITAGSDVTGVGILVMPLILKTDSSGRLVDENDRLIDSDGWLINASGQFVNEAGDVLSVPPGSPVAGGQPVRLSGGEIRTGTGGTISLTAADTLLLRGAIGSIRVEDSTIQALSETVTLISTGSSVTVEDRIEAAGQVTVSGKAVNVLAGGSIRARGDGGDIRLKAESLLYTDAAFGDLPAAIVHADDLVSLLASDVDTSGALRSSSGRIVINGVKTVTVGGRAVSPTSIHVNSGVSAHWSQDLLESGVINAAELTSGTLDILGSGSLQATETVRLNSGGNFTVQSATDLASGMSVRPRPLVSTAPQTTYTVTGYNKIDLGVIEVPEVTLVTTTEQREVAADTFVVGRYYNVMDVALTQDAYYNVNAPSDKQIREYFVEGIDYFNSQIAWSSFGVYDPPAADYRSQSYRTFSQLTDQQRLAVLRTLGYLPLYDFSYSNARTVRTLDGNVTQTAWIPKWVGNPIVTYSIDVAGWEGKAIRMPRGANEDVLRVVSQGSPEHWQEKVGRYRNLADVAYQQDRTAFNQSTYNDPLTGKSYPATDADPSPSGARWQVTYLANGLREYSVLDGREVEYNRSVTASQKPQWQWDVDAGTAAWNAGTAVNGISVYAPKGYVETTESANVFATFEQQWKGGQWEKKGYFLEGSSGVQLFQNSEFGESWILLVPNGEWSFNGEMSPLPAGFGDGLFPDLSKFDVGLAKWNGTISSLKVDEGARVEAFDGINFSGDKTVWNSGDYGDLGSWNDKIKSLKISNYFDESYDISETRTDWNMNWRSYWSDIYDTRSRYFYQWVSLSHDIYGKRPRYETVTVDAKVVQQKFITKWGTEEILTPQTVLKPARIASTEEVPYGEFLVDAVQAGEDVVITSRGAMSIGGRLQALTGDLTLTATGTLSINGTQPGSTTAAQAIAAPAFLQSPTLVNLSATGGITVGESSRIQSAGDFAGGGRVVVSSPAVITLSGTFAATDEMLVSGGSTVTLDGRITTGNLIDIRSGQGNSGTGSISGTFYAELVTENPESSVLLRSGPGSGSITLVNSLITSNAQVSLISPAGAVTHGPGESITADLIYVRAASGIDVRTNTSEVDFATTSAGGITLTNLQALTANVTAVNGPVSITALGTLTAARVEALGASAANSVTLKAESPDPTQKAHLYIQNMTASEQGSLTLTAHGVVSGTAGFIKGNQLTIQGDTIPTLVTEVNSINLTTLEPGSLSLTQLGTKTLTVNAAVRDGALTIDHALGNVILNSVRIFTNSDANDLTVTAGGAIQIGAIFLGDFYASAAELPAAGNGAVSGHIALGDVRLKSGGSVEQTTADGGVDVIADQLVIEAATGIGVLQTSVNELTAATEKGSIHIEDTDSYGELGLGLSIVSATAPDGNVTILGNRTVDVIHVVAGGPDGTVRLTSLAGNLTLIQPEAGDTITYNRGVALSAGKTLSVYRFFEAPDLMEYRGDEIVIAGVTDRLGIPAVLEGDTIILEQRNGIRLKNQTSLKAEHLELLTDRNLALQNAGSISAGELVMRALGTESVVATVYNPATGGTQTISQATGNIRIEAASFNAVSWDARALRNIVLDISANTGINTVSGYIGGLNNSVPAETLTWRSLQALQFLGATLSADLVILTGRSVAASSTAKVTGKRLEVEASGAITLNTALESVVAISNTAGNITILEENDILLDRVYAENGTVTARARGTLTARSVVSETDAVGRDITLIADGPLYVDYVDAGRRSGLFRNASKVTLRSKKQITEPPSQIDNVVAEGSSMIDVAAFQIKLEYGQASPAPALIKSEGERGYSNELEIMYTAQSNGVTSGVPTPVNVPTQVTGDYVLYAPDYTSDINLNVTGRLYVVYLDPMPGQSIRLNASQELVIATDLNAGNNAVQLQTPGNLQIAGEITAGSLNITASTVSDVLNTRVETMNFNLTTSGSSLAVFDADNLAITGGSGNNSQITARAGGNMLLSGALTGINSLALSSADSLTSTSGFSVTVPGSTSLAGGSISIGGVGGGTFNTGDLTFRSTGSVRIVESSSSRIVGNNTAGTVDLISGSGGLTLDGNIVAVGSVTVHAQGSAADLTLNATLSSAGGTVDLRANEDLVLNSAVDINSGGGDISIVADHDGNGLLGSGEFRMADGSSIDAGGGRVDIQAPGDIVLGIVRTTSEGRLTSFLGEISDGGDGERDLEGGAFALRARTGIGRLSALETSVKSIAFVNTVDGDVQISNIGGLQITAVDGLTSSSTPDNVVITATSPITVSAPMTQASVLLQAVDVAATNYDNITIEPGVLITATAGNILFEAGDRILLGSGSELRAQVGEIILRSAHNDIDGDGGMVLDGLLYAQTAGQFVTLNLNDQQGAVQGSFGSILATHLRLLSTGNSDASCSLGASLLNDVDVLASLTSGSVSYRDTDSLQISTVAASDGGAAVSGVSTVNGVAEGRSVSVIAVGALTADQPIRTSPASAAGSLSAGSVLLQSLSSTLTLTDNADIIADGAVNLTAADRILSAAEITTSSDDVSVNSTLALIGAVTVDTGSNAGSITFNRTVNGSQDLTLNAGLGSIAFNQSVGQTTRLKLLKIVSTEDATFAGAISAEAFLQEHGTGTTTFSGLLHASTPAGVDVTGTNLHVVTGISTINSGTISIRLMGNSPDGVALFDNNAHINADGAVSIIASTRMTTGGNITTTNDAVTIDAATVLTQDVTIDVDATGAAIHYTKTIDGTMANAQSLTLDAGAQGTVLVNGAIGRTTALRELTLVDSNGATFGDSDEDSVNAETKILISYSRNNSKVLFRGAATTALLTASPGPYFLNLEGNGSSIGTADFRNDLVVTIGSESSDVLLVQSDFVLQTPQAIEFQGTLRTTGRNVLLGDENTVIRTLVANSRIDTTGDGTYPTGGHITIAGLLDGKTGSGLENLQLTVGTAGNIDFLKDVGLTNRLGTLDIVVAKNVTIGNITAQAFLQQAGTGTTTLNGAVDTNTAAGVDLTTVNLIVNSSITTTASGIVNLSATDGTPNATDGTVTINRLATIVATGDVTLTGNRTTGDAILVHAAGSFTVSGNTITGQTRQFITATTGASVTIHSPIRS
jgi:hypothetical protein